MDRRSFLETLKNLGLLGAVGIPALGAPAVKGDAVDITMVKGTVAEKMSGFRLFADLSADRFGAEDESVEKGFIREKGNRSHIPLSKVLEAVRGDGRGPEVTVVTLSAKGPKHDFSGEPGCLYVDRTADEFGIMPWMGSKAEDGRVFIPLSGVMRLLKKAGLV